jgi:hypothetical protein
MTQNRMTYQALLDQLHGADTDVQARDPMERRAVGIWTWNGNSGPRNSVPRLCEWGLSLCDRVVDPSEGHAGRGLGGAYPEGV